MKYSTMKQLYTLLLSLAILNNQPINSYEIEMSQKRINTYNDEAHSVAKELIKETRSQLVKLYKNNQNILQIFDRLTHEWENYFTNKWWNLLSIKSSQFQLETLLEAVLYSAEMFDDQYNKDANHPTHIVHPLDVCEILWVEGQIRSVNVLVAALLHNTQEFTNATEEEINELFGPRVLCTVKEITNDPNLNSEENKERQVDLAQTMSMDAQLILIANKINLLRELDMAPPPSWSEEKIHRAFEWGYILLIAIRDANPFLTAKLDTIITTRLCY